MSKPRSPFRSALDAVIPYKGGMSLAEAGRRYRRTRFAKLASNENPFGPSPNVAAAVRDALHEVEFYPDAACTDLRARLSADLDVDPTALVFGPGSEAILDYALRATVDPGDVVVQSAPTFPSYAIVTKAIGAIVRDVTRKPDFSLDVDAVIASVQDGVRVLVLCTPNNPTGNLLSRADFARILAALPKDVVLLLDEAYREYIDADKQFDPLPMLRAWGGTWLALRTFSKAYGLASMRVGYGIASSPDFVAYIDRLRPFFNVPTLSQAAALAAWSDQAHLHKTVAATVAERARLLPKLRELGLTPTDSQANFHLFEVADAVATSEAMLAEGVIVRPIPFGTRSFLRVSIGTREDNDWMLTVLAEQLRKKAA
ncbi:histidinol-phosphate transaminase [Roseiterribacter gracilis]|uniref:Histidinol-phosphate aminotransferase n=1 Tax=Roseiterribacter gracilis TaxID=2812848 RepID=A0A8S8XAA8_9PROT|nr:histidinol-phosphate aminotransferase [Rhodospirillales bacterium TMPK1]